MIHVKVKKSDIRKGRLKAKATCGCPIWHALSRALRSICGPVDTDLTIPHVEYGLFGGFKLVLPEDAVEFQRDLIADFSAHVVPFDFDADVVVARGGK